MAARVKRLADRHPFGCVVALAIGWYGVLVAVQGGLSPVMAGWPEERVTACAAAAAASVPLAFVAACGWWRETGLRWQIPTRRWWLVLPLVVASALSNPLGPVETIAHPLDPLVMALAVGCSVEIVSRGASQFVLRRSGPWTVTVSVAALFGAADVLAAPHVDTFSGDALAFAFVSFALGLALGALRWRVNTLWPLAFTHALFVFVNTHPGARPLVWRLLVGVALLAYGS